MRRTAKAKTPGNPSSSRKNAVSGSAAARRSFPAWIDAGDVTTPFSAVRGATPRVRDGLVLRPVSKRQPGERSVPNALGVR